MGDKALLSSNYLNVTGDKKVGTSLCGTNFHCIAGWTFGLPDEFWVWTIANYI